MQSSLTTLSNSINSTARLFFLRELFLHDDNSTYSDFPRLIIVDKHEDISFMQNFATTFLGKEIHIIENLSELWTINLDKNRFYALSHILLEYSGNLEHLKRQTIHEIKRGMEIKMEEYIDLLIGFGYIHQDHVGEIGTYKREGSLISITTNTGSLIQIEWFDTEVDNIIETSFLTGTRVFRENITLGILSTDSIKIERSMGVLNIELLNFIKNRFPTIILFSCDFLTYIEELRKFANIHFTDFHRENSLSLNTSLPTIEHIDALLSYLTEWTEEKYSNTIHTFIYTKFEKSVQDFLEFHGLSGIKLIPVEKSGIESVEVTHEQKKTIIIADDIIGQIFVKTRKRKSLAKNLDLLISLSPGDYVVHREHGIARFDSVVKKEVNKISREYLELHYAEGDKLFVPLTEIYRVSKYLGELEPELTRLTGKEWERAIEKADEEIEAIAQDIIETTARRTITGGRAFGIFREEEKKFQEAFAYEYTHDQKQAIDEVFADMELEEPMDRLLSGDVGFGKTEVAMNAIYKAVLSGTQVAVISPLLVLADEHYETFLDRLGPFGVRVEILTRMNTEKEAKQILERLKAGKIDVIVGTHRLLSDDIIWKKLGLLVVDEEHKFGVSHKEKIKKIRAGIDILSLSATPIPRSLNLALSGLRKISLLTTPPKKKKPIKTIISKWHEPTIKHAIEYELERGGQVIILHNRIRGMENIEKEIQNILKNEEGRVKNIGKKVAGKVSFQKRGKTVQIPKESKIVDKQGNGGSGVKHCLSGDDKQFLDEQSQIEGVGFTPETFGTFGHESTKQPRIIITHGQMPGDVIEDRIHAFKKREYDILLTTTIIENGVNFLSANTIIILDPEDFGLASLHQLRGRVGRKDTEGFCYLVYQKPELSKDEKERLITIANNSHLGAGFEIAMRDLEIRGAGEVLGIKQSGKSKDIGLTLYFRMLEEKIEVLKQEKKSRVPVKIELDLSYTLDDRFFLSERDKLQFFRDIENIESSEELNEVEKELKEKNTSLSLDDTSLTNLFLLLRCRLALTPYGVEKLSRNGMNYIFDFVDDIDSTRIKSFLEHFDTKKTMVLLSIKKIRVETKYWKTLEEFLIYLTQK